ncbi:MAG: hypothetical protein J3K34DRAFT_458401 [Monoraphidium minutum]|nr:MAG: hypothetical protein J3K34DRAFT_458401 [Monoraphidium minutum]
MRAGAAMSVVLRMRKDAEYTVVPDGAKTRALPPKGAAGLRALVASAAVNDKDVLAMIGSGDTLQVGGGHAVHFPSTTHNGDATDGPVMVIETPDSTWTWYLESEDTWHLDFKLSLKADNTISAMHGLLGQSLHWTPATKAAVEGGDDLAYIVADGLLGTDFNAGSAPAVYTPPSQRIGANELQALSRLSNVVPDTLLLETPVQPKAATVSAQVLKGVLASGQLGLKPFMNAIENSRNYEKCLALKGADRASCQLDKALANVGSMLAQQVEGRVATELDPRLADDKDALVAKAKALSALYAEMGVAPAKLIFRLPATWAGIQAAAALEKEGVATQVFHIYSLVQGIAAAQAGVSVIQPNVGRTRDWYNKHPGVIRDPNGPREDSGFSSRVDPGVQLVRRLYGYAKARHPKSQIMASGIRSKADALALAGCDYLVLSARVMAELEGSPTLQGYNSGFKATASVEDDEGVTRQLAPDAMTGDDEVAPLGAVTEAAFNEGLGLAGKELLEQGVAGMVRDTQAVLPYFEQMAVSAE